MKPAATTPEDVLKLAALARLTIAPEKLESFAQEFESILAYIGQLDELTIDTKALPKVPLLHNVFRADEHPTASGTNTQKLAAQFPEREGEALVVKQIITHD